MDIVTDSVNRLEEMLKCSGCEETGVRLDVDPDAHNCQFERGACMTASFGGRTAEFVTDDPIRATTKISFMFGTPLEPPESGLPHAPSSTSPPRSSASPGCGGPAPQLRMPHACMNLPGSFAATGCTVSGGCRHWNLHLVLWLRKTLKRQISFSSTMKD